MTEYKDKICRHCIYGDKTEYEKPCVIYSDDCKFFKSKPKVLIQEYTNNGSMIIDIFNITDTKNVKTSINEEQNLVEVCGDGFTMWFDIDWWDAPYESDRIEAYKKDEEDTEKRKNINIGDRVKFLTAGGWYNSGIIKDINEDSYLIEVDELGCNPPKDMYIQLPYYARVLSCEIAESEE